MTTYNTGNPLGSVDVRDLYDNAQNLDNFSNGPAAAYADRFGVQRQSLQGIRNASQYQVLGPYAAGLVFTSNNQVFSYLGEFYAPGPSIVLPYTTTGSGASEIANFRSVGDAVLRSDLANSTNPLLGSGLNSFNPTLTYQSGTAGAVIKDTQLRVTANESGLSALGNTLSKLAPVVANQFTSSLSPLVVDMHYGTLCGAGWTAGDPVFNPGVDPFNVITTTTSAAVGTSSTDIPVVSSSGFVAGMLLCYLATDGQYYSARLHEVRSGPTLRLDRQLPAQIALGGQVFNFYRDDAHPNTRGGACLVDDALRQLRFGGRVKQLEWRGTAGAIWSATSGTTVATTSAVDYKNPGSATTGEQAVTVSGTPADAGVVSTPVALLGGDYEAYVVINTGTRTGNFSSAITVSIQENRTDGSTFVVATSGFISGYDATRSVKLKFSVAPGSSVKVFVLSANTGPYSFTVGTLEYVKLQGKPLELNRGKHVLFGDSWFSAGSAFVTRFTERMDASQVVVAGVGGNKANQLIDRFSSDVAVHSPNYVWVMVGTNDYYAGVTPALFEQQILQLRRLIQDIGAQAIFFTPSVGAVTFSPQQLHPSRRYALNVNYHEVASSASGVGAVQRSGIANVQGLSVAAGATVTAWVFPASTRKVAYLRFLAINTAGVNVRFEYCLSADGAGGVEPTIYNTTTPVRDVPLPRVSDTALRFVCIRINNPTGAPVVVSLTADVCWAQDLV